MGRPQGPPLGGQPLSERELRVVALVAHGLTNGQIGARIFISEQTVRTHLTRTRAKLGARSKAHIVTIAFCRGLLKLPDFVGEVQL